jgi:hypothetical protein
MAPEAELANRRWVGFVLAILERSASALEFGFVLAKTISCVRLGFGSFWQFPAVRAPCRLGWVRFGNSAAVHLLDLQLAVGFVLTIFRHSISRVISWVRFGTFANCVAHPFQHARTNARRPHSRPLCTHCGKRKPMFPVCSNIEQGPMQAKIAGLKIAGLHGVLPRVIECVSLFFCE